MKPTNAKGMITKAMMVGLAAGAVALAAPQKAQAQVSFGVQVGYPPVYTYAPGYYAYPPDDYARREYYERLRREREREAWERHEAWERQQAYYRYAYGYRDHDRRDHDDHRDWDRDRR